MQNKKKNQSRRPGDIDKETKTESENIKFHLERLQLENDLAKHIATLNTASILIITTFLEKLSANPERKDLLGYALVGFIISLIGVLVYQFALVMEASGRVYRRDLEKKSAYFWRVMIEGGGIAAGLTGFTGGLLALAIFAIVNL